MKIYKLLILTIIFPISLHAQDISYPATHKAPVKDDYHGTIVVDHYQWLEDATSEETKRWVENQNQITFEHLSNIPFRPLLKEKLENLWHFQRQSTPKLEANHYYYYNNTGTQNHSILFRRPVGEGEEEIMIDPNMFSDDGTVSLRFYNISRDGLFAAYGISRAGSDKTEIKILECESKNELSDVLTGVKFSTAAWANNGFYYSKYDINADEINSGTLDSHHKVYYHQVGTPQTSDVLIYEDKLNPKRNFRATTSYDENLVFISSFQSSTGNDMIAMKINDGHSSRFQIANGFENLWSVVDADKENILLITNENAPKKMVVEMEFGKKNKKVIIPEKEETLISVVRASNKLVAHYMKDASSRLYVYSLKGTFEKEISLPEFCTVTSMNGHRNDSLLFYSIAGFTMPNTTFTFNLVSGNNDIYFQPELNGFNSDDYETKQVFYSSKDGTEIPMFLVSRIGIVHEGNNPVLLYGYGGFNISKTPEFLIERLLFLEQGGILALPNLRGGGEYGKSWHQAGIKLKKQNVFDDFIAAAEYLISEKITSPEKLAIGGRSNGGLLVGAAMTQRPELFKVALPAVGVMDMLRFHKFTIGWAWIGDFGSSDNAEEFKALMAYSPVHNIRKGVTYPATLVTTGDHDDRVIPGHSYKFIATLQENNRGENPVMLRVEVDSGHGAGKPVSKIIDEQGDVLSFMMYHLGMKP